MQAYDFIFWSSGFSLRLCFEIKGVRLDKTKQAYQILSFRSFRRRLHAQTKTKTKTQKKFSRSNRTGSETTEYKVENQFYRKQKSAMFGSVHRNK